MLIASEITSKPSSFARESLQSAAAQLTEAAGLFDESIERIDAVRFTTDRAALAERLNGALASDRAAFAPAASGILTARGLVDRFRGHEAALDAVRGFEQLAGSRFDVLGRVSAFLAAPTTQTYGKFEAIRNAAIDVLAAQYDAAVRVATELNALVAS